MLRPCAVAILALLLAGCGGPSVRLRGIAPLNRNVSGESTPVDVRIYPLREQGRFQGAAFEALWTDAEKVLGPDLIAAPTVATVLPGVAGDAPQRITVQNAGQAQWIGVLALVRKGDGTPRTLILPVDRAGEGVVELTGYGLRVIDLAAEPAPVLRTTSGSEQP